MVWGCWRIRSSTKVAASMSQASPFSDIGLPPLYVVALSRRAMERLQFRHEIDARILPAGLLQGDVSVGVEQGDDVGVINGAAGVAAVTDAESRREFAHRMIVAMVEGPLRRIEAVLVGIGPEPLRRI